MEMNYKEGEVVSAKNRSNNNMSNGILSGEACDEVLTKTEEDISEHLSDDFKKLEFHFSADIFREKLNEIKDYEPFQDFTIESNGKEFHVSKYIMAAVSDYFKTMLLSGFMESAKNKTIMNGYSSNTIEITIDYAYTGKIAIGKSNLHELIAISNYLLIEDIQLACSNVLQTLLNPSNCIKELEYCDKITSEKYVQPIVDFCAQNFHYIILLDNYLSLNPKLFLKLIENPDLHSKEESIFFASIKWIEYNYEERSDYLPKILQNIRLTLFPKKFLVTVVCENSLILKCNRSQKIIEKVKDYLLYWKYIPPKIPEHPYYENEEVLDRRECSKVEPRIFAVGGWYNTNVVTSLEEYNPETDVWTEKGELATPRCGAGVAILKDILYAFGGSDGDSTGLTNVSRYHIKEDRWLEELLPLDDPRVSPAVVTIGHHIYIIGGQHKDKTLALNYRFDPFTGHYSLCTPMIVPKVGAGIAVVDKKIFIVGGGGIGENSDSRSSTKTVECYDPETDSWTSIKPMTFCRKHTACAVYKNRLFVAGGRDLGDTSLTEVEVYDPNTETWEPYPEMLNPRGGLGLVCHNDTLYAIGGSSGQEYRKSVESYDLLLGSKGIWHVRPDMHHARLGAGYALYTGYE